MAFPGPTNPAPYMASHGGDGYIPRAGMRCLWRVLYTISNLVSDAIVSNCFSLIFP